MPSPTGDSGRSDRRLVTQDAVTRALAESTSLDEAAPRILHSVCEHLGWEVGVLWSLDRQANVLRCIDVWHKPTVAVPAFEAESRRRLFPRGVGLPGRVWATGQAAWIQDVVDDPNFPRAPIAANEGLHGAFGFPVALDEEVLGVIEFFSHEIREPDQDLLEMMTAIGSQIGQFIERKLAEEAMRLSEQRFARFMLHLPGLAWIKDLEGRYVYANDAAVKAFRVSRESLYGRKDEEIFSPETAAQFKENDRKALASGSGVQVIETLEDEEGNLHTSLVAKFPIMNSEGKAAMVGGMAIEITDRLKMEAALRNNEERFRLLAETVPSVIWTAAPDGTITYANERWYKYTGLTPEQNARSWPLLVLHPDDYDRCITEWTRALNEGVEYEIEVRNRRHDGEYRWFLTRAVPIRGPDGRLIAWFGTTTDIHDRKRVENNLRLMSRASELLASSVTHHTLDNVCRLAVPDLADWCIVDLIGSDGRPSVAAMHHSDPKMVERAQQLIRDSRRDPHGRGEFEKSMRAGELVMVPEVGAEISESHALDEEQRALIREFSICSYIAVPLIAHGRLLGVLRLASAESRRRFSKDEVAIARELGQRAAVALDNARMYEELRENDRRKDEFIATLAHELRNPLAPICNALQIMHLAKDKPATVEQARMTLERQVNQMVRLIDDLLDLSRISSGKIELYRERIELAAAVENAIEVSRSLIDANRHELIVQLPREAIFLDADLTRLSQVFSNLLNNAARYTEPGGQIFLTAERIGGEVVVKVRDTGIGISPELLPGIFEMFMQVDRWRSQSGLGVGLALVKRLVEMHGGTVEAQSAGPGMGSEFTVRLPAAPGAATSRPVDLEGPAAKEVPATRILIADDNGDTASTLATMLQIMGHEVCIAGDGFEAVERAPSFHPDVIVLDLEMPRLNGWDAARRIRQQPWGKDVLLIALTGWGQEEDKRRTVQAGFNHHLVKPVDANSLQELLSVRLPGPELPA